MDLANAVVIGASVRLKSVDTGEIREVQSNASGVYRFTFVKPGSYEISGTSKSLKSDRGSLIASVGQVEVLDLHLKVEEAKEVVLVTEAAPLLNTDNANIVYTLSTRQLELLPLPGGDMVSVAYAVPGVVINPRCCTGSFASAGIGSVSNLFTFNGTDEMDPYGNGNSSGTTGLLLGANEVQQASVIQNPYDGQYGRQAGAQVNFVTKSGTNAYHGNLDYNYNGTSLNANGFFANSQGLPRQHEVSNQYAASFGGYAIKDKLFFFADAEGLRFAVPGSTSAVTIPSPALESYSLMTIQPSQVSVYQQMFNLYNRAPGNERAVPVTNGNGLIQDTNRLLGCGSLAGTPTGTGGTFGVNVSCADAWAIAVPRQTSEWLLSTRVDYNLNSRQRMYFRFKTDHGNLLSASNLISPVFNVISTQPDYEGQLNHTLVITPHLVNNFIGAVTYNDYTFGVPDLAVAQKTFPFRINLDDRGTQLVGIGPPPSYPNGRRLGQFQLIDDISYQAGRHSLKVGVNYRYNRVTDVNNESLLQGAVFGLDLQEFAEGNINDGAGTYTQSFTDNPVLHLRLNNIGTYIQDQWAVAPRLKITASLRFDRTGNPSCVDRCFSRLVKPFPELNQSSSTPYNLAIQSGLTQEFYNIEPIVPQPRLGLAYSPDWSRDTVLRGGIGLFYDLYASSFSDLMGFLNPPGVVTPVVTTGLINTTDGPGSAPAIAAASANAFQSQFAKGATLAQLQQAVAPWSFSPPSALSLPLKLRSPKYLEWSLEVERRLGAKNVLTVRYLGNYGYDIFVNNPNVNAGVVGFIGLPSSPPDPRFSLVWQFTNNGYANYNAMTTVFRRALGHGFQGQVSYTWSHALDTVSNGGLPFSRFTYLSVQAQINPINLRSLNYSNADYDVRHNVAGDFVWESSAKFRSRFMSRILGGWSFGSRVNAHTGFPFSVVNSRAGSEVQATVLADVVEPNVGANCGRAAVKTPCLSATDFVPASSQNNFGNLPRNSFRGPGFFDLDTSVYRTVAAGERMRFSIGTSAYNLLNHPNFGNPNAVLGGQGFGLIRNTINGPSGPYGSFGGPSGRALVVTGKFKF
jgi:hypothetical protein